MENKMKKAVIFDVDGVLVDSFEANFKFFTDLMNKFDQNFMEKGEFSNFFNMPMKDLIRKTVRIEDEEEIEKIWKSGKDREVQYPDELLNIPQHLEETIKSLNRDYILGIVTSRNASDVFNMEPISHFKQWFRIVIGYSDTKNHKPHPEPLILVAERLGLKTDECVYIGDSESDILAAKAAGMKAVLYHKENLHDADANFSSFIELEDIIKSI